MNPAFEKFFSGLARHAPGTDEDTLRALRACELPDNPTILDMGAGTGSSALVLAEETDGTVTAIDQVTSSLASLAERAERRGLTNLDTLEDDYLELPIEDESVDLIWSEGSIYAAGWREALDAWRPLLRPGGYLVVSDCVWVTDDRAEEAETFWRSEYPGMTTIDALEEVAADHGFDVVEIFEMERKGWVDYYGPIRQRAQLFGSSKTSEAMSQVVEGVSRELEIFEAHGESWNYAFFILRKTT